MDLIGCTIPFYKQWLESQFKRGMSWDNYGEWEIDHKEPLASFDLSKPEDRRRAFHYSNTQPLPARTNSEKHDKIIPVQRELLICIK